LVEVEQFARAGQSVDLPADRGLVEVEPAVTRADLRDEIDVANLLGMALGVGREPLGLADCVGLRVVVGVNDVELTPDAYWSSPSGLLGERKH
jgi:hypothetical protein